MKSIGLLGGLGPGSTVLYYDELLKKSFKDNGVYPQLFLNSVSLQKAVGFLEKDDLLAFSQWIVENLKTLELAGAEIFAIASNTPHIVIEQIKQNFNGFIVDILEVTAQQAKQRNYKRLLLLGTGFTMKSGFYEKALLKKEIEVYLPSPNNIEKLHQLIMSELEHGFINESSRQWLLDMVAEEAIECNAQAVILGCTELPIAIKKGDLALPLLDTARIHIQAILEAAENV